MSSSRRVPFNWPEVAGNEFEYMRAAVAGRHLSGNGPFTKRCQARLEAETGCRRALLTHSCTAALEMAALLLDLEPGDEVIMPSFAFVSTANAFVLRRAIPVFVDVRPDTLNIDETLVEAAITPRTRAIVALHYAGVACEMDRLLEIAGRHQLAIVEDAAQAIRATYRGRPLGAIGQLGALSFHETKNVISGEGGALLVNDNRYTSRAEIIWEKGTNRSEYMRGQVDKYTWLDIGSSYLPGDMTAAFLLAQLEQIDELVDRRLSVWHRYHRALEPLEDLGMLRRPKVPESCGHNGHIYYILLPSPTARAEALELLRNRGIDVMFHYVPLHSAPAGRRFGRTSGSLEVTDDISARLLRLPLWAGMTDEQSDVVIEAIRQAMHVART